MISSSIVLMGFADTSAPTECGGTFRVTTVIAAMFSHKLLPEAGVLRHSDISTNYVGVKTIKVRTCRALNKSLGRMERLIPQSIIVYKYSGKLYYVFIPFA
jgi:hypothetical protein